MAVVRQFGTLMFLEEIEIKETADDVVI